MDTYGRHAEKLREELTLARIDFTPASPKNSTWKASWRLQNASCRVPPTSGCRLSLDQRQRFQQLFFPDGIAF
jgi:hypothetical protein